MGEFLGVYHKKFHAHLKLSGLVTSRNQQKPSFCIRPVVMKFLSGILLTLPCESTDNGVRNVHTLSGQRQNDSLENHRCLAD